MKVFRSWEAAVAVVVVVARSTQHRSAAVVGVRTWVDSRSVMAAAAAAEGHGAYVEVGVRSADEHVGGAGHAACASAHGEDVVGDGNGEVEGVLVRDGSRDRRRVVEDVGHSNLN